MSRVLLASVVLATYAILTACGYSSQHAGKKEGVKGVADAPGAAPAHAGRRLLRKAWPEGLNVANSNVALLEPTRAPDLGVHYGIPPAQWPGQRPWKPRAFYGPWFAGSHPQAIQLTFEDKEEGSRNLSELQTKKWYFTDYFHETMGTDFQIYQQYIPNITRSMAAPPAFSRIPGKVPRAPTGQPDDVTDVSFTDIYLHLDEIHLSSRYGGSVELVFRSRENVEFEIQKVDATGSTLWDVGTLEAHVFSTPKKDQMNPLGPETNVNNFDRLNVELESIDVTEYSGSGAVLQREADVDVQKLTQVLESLADNIEADTIVKKDANQFVHAWLHVEHQVLIDRAASPPERVDAIEISDDFLDMETSAREPWFTWYIQIVHLTSSHDLHHFKIDIAHNRLGLSTNIPSDVVTLHQSEASRLIRAGHFPLQDCDLVNDVRVKISVRDFHPPGRFPALRQVWNDADLLLPEGQGGTVAEAVLDVDCNDLRTFQASIGPGAPRAVGPGQVIYDDRGADITLLDSDLDSHGTYAIRAELRITYR